MMFEDANLTGCAFREIVGRFDSTKLRILL